MKTTLTILALCISTVLSAQVMSGLKAYYPFGGNTQDVVGTNHLSNASGPSAGTFVAARFGNADCAFEVF